MAGPGPGTYGFYQDVRPSQPADIVGAGLKGFQVGDASRKKDEALQAAKKKAADKAASESLIDPIEIDGMSNWAGEMGAATAGLVSQAGAIASKARDQYELYVSTGGKEGIPESEYVQITTNLQASAQSWTELAELRKDDYQKLKELDKAEYDDGSVEAELMRQRKSWEYISGVSYNDKGMLVFNVTEDEQLPDNVDGPPARITKQKSIGEFYALTEPKDLSKSRKNIYKAVEESSNAEQYLWDWSGPNSAPKWNYNPESTNPREQEITNQIKDLALLSDEALIGDKQVDSEVAYLSRLMAAQNPDMSAEQVGAMALDMHQTKLMQIHVAKEKAKFTEAVKKHKEEQAKIEREKDKDKQETYYPEVKLEDKMPYTVETGNQLPINKGAEYVTIDYTKIKGGLQKEQFGGLTVEDEMGKPMADENGQFINNGKFETKLGVARGFIVIPGKTSDDEPKYYIELGAYDDEDLNLFMQSGGNIPADMLEEYARDIKYIEVSEKEIRDQSKRFPKLYDVLIGNEVSQEPSEELIKKYQKKYPNRTREQIIAAIKKNKK